MSRCLDQINLSIGYSGDFLWWFTCNCLGDSFPLSVASSSVDLGMPVMLAATTPMFSGGDMASGHVLRLEHSTVLRHVFFDMLLVVPLKILMFLRREGRWLRAATSMCIFNNLWCSGCSSRGSSIRRRRRQPGDPCLDLYVIFFLFKGACVRVAM